MKHTPTPWYISTVSTGLIRTEDNSEVIDYKIKHSLSDYESVQIGQIGYVFLDNETSKANAEFIVRAVNTHNELLEACKLALEFMESVNNGLSYRALKIKKAIEQAEEFDK